MPFRDSQGVLYFTDEAVERTLGISASKLRTAQRYNLIESLTALYNGRHVRVWPELMVMLAYMAQMTSDHLGVPFQVACCIALAARNEHPGSDEMEADFLKGKLPRRSLMGAGRHRFPLIVVTDREVVSVFREGFHRPLGRLKTGDDGRMSLQSDDRVKVPGDGRWTSRNSLDTLAVVKNFRSAVDTA